MMMQYAAVGLLFVGAVFFACAVIDMVRQWIFKFVFQNKVVNGLFEKFGKFENGINGGTK